MAVVWFVVVTIKITKSHECSCQPDLFEHFFKICGDTSETDYEVVIKWNGTGAVIQGTNQYNITNLASHQLVGTNNQLKYNWV
ncbi:hypothetical protein [Vibrio quintilis]|uniref:Uncharacterized protein n=1 Tax=Vibrio quintilis TaxID=1117707 RepID=A0A1M7Z168_9VIBR|nr:hypothetical protein [Vibrio quintilis]SHO58601.1 hypothetical protein VQ7734_04373 [Vibrio quintilis]